MNFEKTSVLAAMTVLALMTIGCQGSRESDLERAMRENDAQGSAVHRLPAAIARTTPTAAAVVH